MPLLLTVDLGTTNCKAVAFDLEGRAIAHASSSYPTYSPLHGCHEQRVSDWLDAVRHSIKSVNEQLGPQATRISGLALSTWGPGLVLLDREGTVLNEHVPTWQDTRSYEHGRQLLQEVGTDWVGGGMPLSGFPAKLAWACQEWPSLARRAALALGVKDYLLYWLTGSVATEPSSGPYGDHWPCAPFQWMGWPEEKLPPVRAATEIGGKLKPDRAIELGLPPGLPVVMGLNDGAAATLGAGAYKPGDGVVSLGTNGVLRVILDRPPSSDDCLRHALFRYPSVGATWVTGGFVLSGGDSLRWLAHVIAPENDRVYEQLLQEAEMVPSGSEGVTFIPYLVGRGAPRPNPDAEGAFFGLRRDHGQGHLARAVLEGVACGLHEIALALRQLGYPLDRVCLTGGGAQSRLWRTIVADLLGNTAIHAGGDSNLGSAIVLSLALGCASSVDDAVRQMVSVREVIVPDPERTNAYAKTYARYMCLADLVAGRDSRIEGPGGSMPLPPI